MKHLADIAKVVTASLALLAVSVLVANALSIDSGDKYAWGENIGWLNWGTAEGDVFVPADDGDLSGYVWGENVGWISLNCSNTSSCGTVDFKVSIDANALEGYAWGENIGWISFSCSNTASCGVVDYGVTFDPDTGEFEGYAWGENVGWVNMNCSNDSSCGTVDFKVRTSETPGGGGGGGFIVTPTPTPSPTPTLTCGPGFFFNGTFCEPIAPTPTATPTTTPPPITPTPFPTGSPPPFPTPPASPTATPSGTPRPTEGPVGRAISGVSGFLDRISDFIFGLLGDSCQGVLGVASCGLAAAATFALAALLVAALLQNELTAAGFSLLQIFGIRKKARVWGVVYDSSTKRAIPLAKLELLDPSGRVLESRYADREGRYGFVTTPASLHQTELKASIRASKPGYRFPSVRQVMGTDYVVYERPYYGGVFDVGSSGIVNFSIPMDSLEPGRVRMSGYGAGLFSGITKRLLWWGFLIGLVAVPLNYYLQPTTRNLIILILFFTMNGLRFLISYRPHGVSVDALTGKRLPFALVTLVDQQGAREGFTVSDENGRFILSGQRNREYDVVAFTPANISPQRTTRVRISRMSRIGRTAWVTSTIRI